jgi:flagellar basal-body rod modification protein FlgD
MTNPVGGVPGVPSLQQQSQVRTSNGTLDSDAFLKLLVAQLKYQDPSKPVDSAAFMAQTAQMQMVESLHQLAEQNAAVIAGQNSLSALALVGKQVTWTLNGKTSSGVVEAMRLTDTGPALVIHDTEVPLSAVTEVEPHPTPSADAKD